MTSKHAAGLATLVIAVLFGACSAFDPEEQGGPPGGGNADAGPDGRDPLEGSGRIRLNVSAPPSVIGASVEVGVEVVRTGDDAFRGPVHVELASAAADATAPSIDIAAEASSATMIVTFAAGRRHGQVPLVVKASGVGAGGEASVSVLLRGASGSLDTGFGKDGIFTLGETNADATGLAVQTDGKIVVGGRIEGDFGAVRLNADGTPDGAFGIGGRGRITAGNLVETNDVVVDATGRVTVAGTSSLGQGQRAVVVRFGADGKTDTSFPSVGGGGTLSLPARLSKRMVADAQGGLFFGGQKQDGSPGGFVVRLTPAGALDTAWGDNGTRHMTGGTPCFGGVTTCYTWALGLGNGGKVYAFSHRGDGGNVFRLSQAGAVETFSGFTSLEVEIARSIVEGPDGYVYIGGDRAGANPPTLGVQRLDASGSGSPWPATSSFTFSMPEASGLTVAKRMLYGADGLTIAAEAMVGDKGALAVAKLSPGGTLVTSFASTGYVTAVVGSTSTTTNALGIDAEGRILVAGSNGDMVVARFWP